jgi:chemotaxis protein methyltransferase CheR
MAKKLRSLPNQTADEYLEGVLADPAGEDFASLIDSLSTNLTSFLREPSHFVYLTEKFLPDLLRRKREQRNNRIRGWSAACSTGEEPYTILFTLLEALEGKGTWDTKVLATDISRNVLRTAILGVYDAPRVQSIPAPIRSKYFEPVEAPGQRGSMRAGKQIRERVVFNYLNLLERWPFSGPLDFIFCRNVMIYFDKQTQERLVSRFWQCLDSGGVLFTGHSESLTGITHRFKYAQPTIYLKP